MSTKKPKQPKEPKETIRAEIPIITKIIEPELPTISINNSQIYISTGNNGLTVDDIIKFNQNQN